MNLAFPSNTRNRIAAPTRAPAKVATHADKGLSINLSWVIKFPCEIIFHNAIPIFCMLPVIIVVLTAIGPPNVKLFCTPKHGAIKQTRQWLPDDGSWRKSARENRTRHSGDTAHPGRVNRCLKPWNKKTPNM